MAFSKKIQRKDFGRPKTDQRKSIEELENDFWADNDQKTSLIEKCHQYRKIPVHHLTAEQLRMLIGQEIGLEFTLPPAFEMLEQDIFTSGDLQEGDLLENVMKVPSNYWGKHPVYFKRLLQIIENGQNDIASYDNIPAREMMQEKIAAFLNRG